MLSDKQTDRQTDTQTDILDTIFYSLAMGGLINTFSYVLDTISNTAV